MEIKDLLKNAGIEDDGIIDAVAAELPKHFVPNTVLNERIAKAKNEAADVRAAFDAYKAEVEAAATKAADDDNNAAKALEELKKKHEELEGRFAASQNAIKERDAKDALGKALKDAGANPAAVALLTASALSRVEYGEDGKAVNVAEAVESIKADNAGLFGTVTDTGEPPAKADGKNEPTDEFLKGFGSTDKN